MTLILTALTPAHAIQVSDRRLTLPSGDLFDDESNKALLYNNHMIIGYTGRSQIGVQNTLDWLADQLFGLSPRELLVDQRLEILRQRLTHEFKPLRGPKASKRLAVAGAGYAIPPDAPRAAEQRSSQPSGIQQHAEPSNQPCVRR